MKIGSRSRAGRLCRGAPVLLPAILLVGVVAVSLATISFVGAQGVDRDLDNVADAIDNCVATANADQADGDNDGFGDACDVDPIAYWPLDESSGSVVPDLTGGNGLDLVGGQWRPSQGQVDGALRLNGVDGHAATADPTATVPTHSGGADEFTLAAWIKPATLNQRRPVLSKQGTTASGAKRGFMFSAGEDNGSGRLYFEVFKSDSSATGKTRVLSDVPLTINTWHHVAATYRFISDGGSEIRLYINGRLAGSSNAAVGPLQRNAQPLELGRYLWASPGYKRHFDGHLDEVYIVGSALDAIGIANLAQGPVFAPPNQPPTAVFDASPLAGSAPLRVDVDANGSFDNDGLIADYVWDFGDGGSAAGASASHIYRVAGVYTLTLTVTDDDGAADSATRTISVSAPAGNQSPSAVFDASPLAGSAPLRVDVDANGSFDNDGLVADYVWDFGDGGSAAGASASYIYRVAGVYTLTLTVTDDDGAADSATRTISVSAPAGNQSPSAVFDASPLAGSASLRVDVDANGSFDNDGLVADYVWDFGDGGSAAGASASYIYRVAGVYTLTLTVTDDDGAADSATRTISVSAAAAEPLPVARWPLDDGSGDQALDQIGASDITLFGPSWSGTGPAAVMEALSFDGGGDYGELQDADMSALLPAQSAGTVDAFTLTAWIYPDTLNRRRPILSKQGVDGPDRRRGFMFSAGEDNGSGKLYFEIFSSEHSGTGKSSIKSERPLAVGRWQHVAVSYRFIADGESEIRLYIDGLEVGSDDTAVGPPQTNRRALELGRYFWARWYQRHFDGLMRDVAIYDNALTADEVRHLTAGGPGGGAGNFAPTARLTVTPQTGMAPLTISADGSASSDDDGAIVSYQWSFDDGGSASGAVVSHRYDAPGSYLLRLAVTDDRGAVDVATAEVAVAQADSSSGLDQRPVNLSCAAPDRPASDNVISTRRAFPNIVFSQATVMLQPPNDPDRWLLAERGGIIRGFVNNDAATATSVALDLSANLATTDFGGLLGMALHPDFPVDNRLFVFHTDQSSRPSPAVINRLSSFRSDDGGLTFTQSSQRTILSFDGDNAVHPGGHVGFGPDGYLYVSIGDGAKRRLDAQDTGNLRGSMLRIDVDLDVDLDVDDAAPYTIPADNPFVNGGGRPEIYAWGFRHPWRWNHDAPTGRLFVGDVGANAREEVNLVSRGGNYGWPHREGSSCTHLPPCDAPDFVDPIAEYSHGDAPVAVIAGFVYRGSALPQLRETFVYTDYLQGTLWGLAFDPQGEPLTPTVLIDNLNLGAAVHSFVQDNAGELYLLQSRAVHRLVLAPAGGSSGVFPQRLSQTGCFRTEDIAQTADGLIPYQLNTPFWSDGAVKRRWFALPEAPAATIGIDSSGDFDFPVGSVLAKSFELNNERVETRLLVRHDDGGWAGYSYEWNAAGDDADLVEPDGKSKLIGGQLYTYPGRNQCLQCHTAAAGFVLGPEQSQLNRQTTYPSTGRTANQLATYQHIGLLSEPLVAPPDELPALPDAADDDVDLASRARAYLHVNCSQCHRPGGVGVGAMDFRYTTADADIGACETAPTQGDLGVSEARLLTPGDPSRSLIALRMNRRDADQMPPLGSNVIDSNGVALIEAWIRSLSACP